MKASIEMLTIYFVEPLSKSVNYCADWSKLGCANKPTGVCTLIGQHSLQGLSSSCPWKSLFFIHTTK